MMTSYLLMTVLVMAVMTYLPRMLPLTFFKKEMKYSNTADWQKKHDPQAGGILYERGTAFISGHQQGRLPENDGMLPFGGKAV